MLYTENIKNRRDNAALARENLDSGKDEFEVNSALLDSWRRSKGVLAMNCSAAPLMDPKETKERWSDSPVRKYCQSELQLMTDTADTNRMIAVVADHRGRILWASGRDRICSWAEQVNFSQSGCWGEGAMGTNALSMALGTGNVVDVLAEEHYLECVDGWVCYAAPIIDPKTGRNIGVIDLSSPVQNYNPMATQLITSIATSMSRQLQLAPAEARIDLKMLGCEVLYYFGKMVKLTKRQLEVVCLLALHPEGLSAAQLALALYGDQPHSRSTIKAEISYLKRVLPHAITSRPYRLNVPIEADFLSVWKLLEKNKHTRALALIEGIFFSHTTSPVLIHWRYCLEAAVSAALSKCGDLSAVIRFATHHPEHEEAMQRIVDLNSPR